MANGFNMDGAKAVEVVTRWRKWMFTKPYQDGSLKLREKQRIKVYHKDTNRMNAMVIRQDKDWCRDIFMSHKSWQLRILWLFTSLYEERYERPTSSPWDSLWKHGKFERTLRSSVFSPILLSACPVCIPTTFF